MIYGIFEIKDKDLAGRIGSLHTKSGKIRTPTLFPVINPVKQEVKAREISAMGFESVITNAYLVKKNLEREALERGIHKILDFQGPIMTDSGAYQILQYGEIEVDPYEIVKFQEKIGSDIAVILDIPTGGYADRSEAERTVMETLRRAKESVKFRSRDDILWVVPVQGGRHLDLVALSARESVKLPYHIVAIGSPTEIMEGYDFETLVRIIMTVKLNIPPGIPIHLFGAGHPMIFPFIVALGVDLFDSAAYAIYAKNDRYLTPYGTYRLEKLSELPCSCPICTKYTVNELLEMSKIERTKLIAKHNLYVSLSELKLVRQAIREGTLWELLEMKSKVHPALHRAFKLICEYRDYLEKLDPEVKGVPHGLFLYDSLSLNRPELIRHKRRIIENYEVPKEFKKAVIFLGEISKPFRRAKEYHTLKETYPEHHILFATPFFNIIPEELSETYPLSQWERGAYDEEVINELVDFIRRYFESKRYSEIVIVYKDDWKRIAYRIYRVLKGKVQDISIRKF